MYPGKAKNTLSNVTMNFDIDSRVAIMGKNGAGKTTLLDVSYEITKKIKYD